MDSSCFLFPVGCLSGVGMPGRPKPWRPSPGRRLIDNDRLERADRKLQCPKSARLLVHYFVAPLPVGGERPLLLDYSHLYCTYCCAYCTYCCAARLPYCIARFWAVVYFQFRSSSSASRTPTPVPPFGW